MKIGIHPRKNGFSQRWIEYCEQEEIPYKQVNCYSNDIIDQLEDCDALMWHFHHANCRDVLFSKQLIYSLQTSGTVVFPDFHTCWFFDDKLGQKYLLESIDAPFVPTYAFYDKIKALEWVETATFPKVFKLRHGASSSNVQLAENKYDARKLIQKAFGRGFSQYRPMLNLKERWRKFSAGQAGYIELFKGVARFGYTTDFDRVINRERGYVLFQDYISNKTSDLRVIVIGQKAFAIKRRTRPGDFRASGSGIIEYGKEHFSEELIQCSFDLAKKLNSKTLALDYVMDKKPMLVEVSFGYSSDVYKPCEGYWDKQLNWYEGSFNPQHWMVDQVTRDVNAKKSHLYEV